MIPAYNKKRCAAVPFETGIHFRRKTDFFPEEDTTKSYSGFEPIRLQAEGHSHHTGWETIELLMTRNTLLGLKSFVFSSIGRTDMYRYGDNPMNPLIVYINRFNLMEHLRWYGACSVGDKTKDDIL
ncbi:hypothetical protein TNCV_4809921 [Trichonephila clavipes]|uniref:Uncharacterized protein n=1 Tax=Trichonephila clavipes TaxID=2585209 RepID=A0A8X6VAI7_TRICX|nr:hypothetical protein TNCV_4809921 [Trichonephila clavipes]